VKFLRESYFIHASLKYAGLLINGVIVDRTQEYASIKRSISEPKVDIEEEVEQPKDLHSTKDHVFTLPSGITIIFPQVMIARVLFGEFATPLKELENIAKHNTKDIISSTQ
jgi:hypothetical protein